MEKYDITNEERQAFWNRQIPGNGVEKGRAVMRKLSGIADDDPDAGEKEVALVEEFLRAGGIDLNSMTEIDIMLERVKDELEDYRKEEARLGKQMEEILLRSGVSKAQIQWGNYRNARFSYMDKLLIRQIKQLSDENLMRNMQKLTLLAALCKNKKRLEGNVASSY